MKEEIEQPRKSGFEVMLENESRTIEERAQLYMEHKLESIAHYAPKYLIRNAFEDGQKEILSQYDQGKRIIELSKRLQTLQANYDNKVESLEFEIRELMRNHEQRNPLT